MAGELNQIDGELSIHTNSIAYLPQIPWIQNKTLRDNVIFDTEDQDNDFYNKSISACALNDDLKLLSNGDLTEIGEKARLVYLRGKYNLLGYKSFRWAKDKSSALQSFVQTFKTLHS